MYFVQTGESGGEYETMDFYYFEKMYYSETYHRYEGAHEETDR